MWDDEETRLHRRLQKLRHENVVPIFHSALKLVKDPKKNRSSFNEKGVAGQGGLTKVVGEMSC
jgi:hypothetical protein